jgi:hypothetical protein
MRCVNCQNEVQVGAIVCPYCHFSPFLYGVGPYDGGPNGRPHPANQPADPISTGIALGLLGAATTLFIPPVGIGLLCVSGVALLVGVFGKKE